MWYGFQWILERGGYKLKRFEDAPLHNLFFYFVQDWSHVAWLVQYRSYIYSRNRTSWVSLTPGIFYSIFHGEIYVTTMRRSKEKNGLKLAFRSWNITFAHTWKHTVSWEERRRMPSEYVWALVWLYLSRDFETGYCQRFSSFRLRIWMLHDFKPELKNFMVSK